MSLRAISLTKHLMLNIYIIQTITQSMIKANVKLKFDDSVQISGQNEVQKLDLRSFPYWRPPPFADPSSRMDQHI